MSTGETIPVPSEVVRDRAPFTLAQFEVFARGTHTHHFRSSVPYGTATEHGPCLVAFSAERSSYDLTLARMFGNDPDGARDRLTDFTRPVSGGYYFAPSLNELNELAGQE